MNEYDKQRSSYMCAVFFLRYRTLQSTNQATVEDCEFLWVFTVGVQGGRLYVTQERSTHSVNSAADRQKFTINRNDSAFPFLYKL